MTILPWANNRALSLDAGINGLNNLRIRTTVGLVSVSRSDKLDQTLGLPSINDTSARRVRTRSFVNTTKPKVDK